MPTNDSDYASRLQARARLAAAPFIAALLGLVLAVTSLLVVGESAFPVAWFTILISAVALMAIATLVTIDVARDRVAVSAPAYRRTASLAVVPARR